MTLLRFPLIALLAANVSAAADAPERPGGTIVFTSLAPRGWDVYSVDLKSKQIRKLTDHIRLDYNASFSPGGDRIAFVSERDGNMEIHSSAADGSDVQRLTNDFAQDDHPVWSPDGKQIAFVSCRQPNKTPGKAWTGLYVMNAGGSSVRRISPEGAADYSPAWTNDGEHLLFASGSGVTGGTAIWICKADGTERRKIVDNGGWPTMLADGKTIVFHSRRNNVWGLWKVGLDGKDPVRIGGDVLVAYTPRASAGGLVAAVHRGKHRQIEIIDPKTGETHPLTATPDDHWNPSISADGRFALFHKITPGSNVPNLEEWASPPGTDVKLLRAAGAFPVFSPDAKQISLTGDGFASIDVMNADGSDRKAVHKGKPRTLFGLAWGKPGIGFSHGQAFQGPEGKVDIALIQADGSGYRTLTADAGNNAFPAFAPDGKQLVFRSGRSGDKNLWVGNVDGSGARAITKGKWTDTMAHWSPSGDLIAVASDRGNNFEIRLLKPDGSDDRVLIGGGGRHNHPKFSPDGKWLAFTSQRAGYSAEEVSLPFQFQPYGDLYLIKLDGTQLTRITYGAFEDGTPDWGPALTGPLSNQGKPVGGEEY